MSCLTKPAGLLLLASLLASAVEMALGVPVLEQQFYATVKGATYHNGTVYRTFDSTMYYDPPNQRFREDLSDRRLIADYKKNVGFEIDASGSCRCYSCRNPRLCRSLTPVRPTWVRRLSAANRRSSGGQWSTNKR